MYVKVYGEGDQQYLCFHGWGGDHREFAPLARYAPAGICMHCVDLPGYGRSPRPRKWEMKVITQEALGYLEKCDITSSILIGFCSGVGLALTLGSIAPGRVRRIFMIDPFAFVPFYFKLFLWGEFGRRAYNTTFEKSIGIKITDWVLKRLQKSDADFTNAFVELDHNVTLRYLQLLHRIDVRREFSGLKMDVDILYGKYTFDSVRRSVDIYKSLLPQIKTHELDDVGHLPMIKDARQLAEAIFHTANNR
ncbi:MAG: alpha/beta hydrolase [Thermodesulfobacteriota bacterium]|nr:alpha/beta hydrolase [Thermodesulfobacteriota bacterium]